MNSALRGGRIELGLWLRIAGKAGCYFSTREVTNGREGLAGLVPVCELHRRTQGTVPFPLFRGALGCLPDAGPSPCQCHHDFSNFHVLESFKQIFVFGLELIWPSGRRGGRVHLHSGAKQPP